jgi:hypothetical protein
MKFGKKGGDTPAAAKDPALLSVKDATERGRGLLGTLFRMRNHKGVAEFTQAIDQFQEYVRDGLADGPKSPAANAFRTINTYLASEAFGNLTTLSDTDMGHIILALASEPKQP